MGGGDSGDLALALPSTRSPANRRLPGTRIGRFRVAIWSGFADRGVERPDRSHVPPYRCLPLACGWPTPRHCPSGSAVIVPVARPLVSELESGRHGEEQANSEPDDRQPEVVNDDRVAYLA